MDQHLGRSYPHDSPVGESFNVDLAEIGWLHQEPDRLLGDPRRCKAQICAARTGVMAINPIHGGGKAVDHRLIHLTLVGLPSLRERLGRDPKPKHHRKIQKMLLKEQSLPWEERTASNALWAGTREDLARFFPGRSEERRVGKEC